MSTITPSPKPLPNAILHGWRSAWRSFFQRNLAGRQQPALASWQAWKTKPKWADFQQHVFNGPQHREIDWIKFNPATRRVSPRPGIVVSSSLLHAAGRCWLMPLTTKRATDPVSLQPEHWRWHDGNAKPDEADTCQVQSMRPEWLRQHCGDLLASGRRIAIRTKFLQHIVIPTDTSNSSPFRRGAVVGISFSKTNIIPSLIVSDDLMNLNNRYGLVYVFQAVDYGPIDEKDVPFFLTAPSPSQSKPFTFDLTLLRSVDKARIRGRPLAYLDEAAMAELAIKLNRLTVKAHQ